MKEYLMRLLELRMKELTNQRNKLDNQYLGATASGLSGMGAREDEIQEEMDKIEACKEKLEELDID